MFTENILNTLADRISDDYIKGSAKLSKLVAEAAKVNKFNDEMIKRLVEAVNHVTFKKLFELKAAQKAPDRNVTFDVADFNDVKKILETLENEEESRSESESLSGSLSASDIIKKFPDLKNIAMCGGCGNGVDEIKTDSSGSELPLGKHVHITIMAVKKASEETDALFEKTRRDYIDKISELATEFSRYNAPDLNKFASGTLAVSKDVETDGEILVDIFRACKEKPNQTKIATDEVIMLPKKEYALFKEAVDIYYKLEEIEKVRNKLKEIDNALNGHV